MERGVLVFPVAPGVSDEEADKVSAMFRERPDEYRESRSRLGITLERAYLQPTPMGSFVMAYGESDGNPGETMGKMAASELPIDQDFVRLVKEIHGFDLTTPPTGAPPETIGAWVDADAPLGKGLAFCAPVIPGQEDAGRRFATEAFQTRRDEMTASRRALGQSKEIVTLHDTPMGPIIAVYLEGRDPVEANRRLAASTEPFDLWFKGELAKIFPPEIDFSQPLPPVKEMFDSDALAS
jgi:hypothetical protein